MCGISGFVSFNNSILKEDLLSLTDSLAHRGPDAFGYYFKNMDRLSVGLGHRRLSIIDLSQSANQPMMSSCGRYVMVYNGEVYNYRELQQSLLSGFNFNTHSDTEVVLESFALLGIDAVQHWNGMFALAIWDILENKLTIIRDRIGKKPLYYYWDEKSLVFSSELKAFKKVNLRLTPDERAIAAYLNVGYIPQPFSIYQEVKKLPPGGYLELHNAEISVKSYRHPKKNITSAKIRDEDEAKHELKNLVISSVKYRMISDVPFGTFLSGGVDSSLITAVAQSLSYSPIKTFSIGFREKIFDESEYAKTVAEYLGTEHHAIKVGEEDGFEFVNDITRVYDEPYADVSAIPTMLVSRFAANEVTMVLSGDGGDELFSGYGTYDWAERLGNPFVWSGRRAVSKAFSFLGAPKYRRASNILDVSNIQNLQQHIFSQEQGFFSYNDIRKHFSLNASPEFYINQNGLCELNYREKQSKFDLDYYLPDDLMVKVDRATMRYGLEARCPLLDYRIVEFAGNLHPDLKKKGKSVKYLLKEVLYDYLPKHLFNRPKWGFAYPLEKLMQNELSYLIDKYLNEEMVAMVNICDYKYIQSLVHMYRSGQTHVYYKLWTLIQLNKWFLENDQ